VRSRVSTRETSPQENRFLLKLGERPKGGRSTVRGFVRAKKRLPVKPMKRAAPNASRCAFPPERGKREKKRRKGRYSARGQAFLLVTARPRFKPSRLKAVGLLLMSLIAVEAKHRPLRERLEEASPPTKECGRSA